MRSIARRPPPRVARAIVAAAIALTGAEPRARAASPFDDPYDLPDAPRSMALPELTHPDVEWTSMTAVGGVTKDHDDARGRTTPAFLQRLAVEVPIGLRRFFAGAAYDVAAGTPLDAGGPARLVGGNVEIYGRTVWATRTGLAFGGGLGLMPSITSFAPDGPSGEVALAAATLQPWDYSFFNSGAFTTRAFVDVRDLVGPVVIQFRQGFDWSVRVASGDTGLAATSTLYLGYRVGSVLGAGVEASELYLVDASIPDAQRAHFVVAPSVRFITRNVQPAMSVFTTVGDPVYAGADHAWGLRFALTVVWDPRHPYSPETSYED